MVSALRTHELNAGRFRPVSSRRPEDQAERTTVRGRLRSAVAERGTGREGAGRDYARSCETAAHGWTDRRRRECLQPAGSPFPRRKACRALHVNETGHDPKRNSRAALADCTRPSEPRAETVTPLSVRTLTGGDAGTGCNVRPSSVCAINHGSFADGDSEGRLALDELPETLLDIKGRQDVPFFAQPTDLAAQPTNLFTLFGAQTVAALAAISSGLCHPGPNGLGRRFELPSQLAGRTTGPNQLDHLLSERPRVRRSRFRHRGYLLLATGSGVRETGATSSAACPGSATGSTPLPRGPT